MSGQVAVESVDTSKKLTLAWASRVGIGHALVDSCSSAQAYSAIVNHALQDGEAAHIITPNAQHIVLLEKDLFFRHIYNHADMAIADGVSLLLAAHLYGRPFPERITGVEAVRQLSGLAAEHGLRILFLGGRPGSADLAAAVLQREFPLLQCSTYCPPYGFEETNGGLSAVANAVRSVKPHLLFVGLGAPKQEYWIHNYGLQLDVPICMGIGGSFEIIGGIVARAPLWIQKMGCEWAYRLIREPRRLWRRYLIGNLLFAGIVLRQLVRRALLNACVRLAETGSFGAELQEFSLGGKAKTMLLQLLRYPKTTV